MTTRRITTFILMFQGVRAFEIPVSKRKAAANKKVPSVFFREIRWPVTLYCYCFLLFLLYVYFSVCAFFLCSFIHSLTLAKSFNVNSY